MKKLLGIVVLGLLLSGNVFAKEILFSSEDFIIIKDRFFTYGNDKIAKEHCFRQDKYFIRLSMNGNVSNKPANYVRYYCAKSRSDFIKNLEKFNKTLPKQFYSASSDRPLKKESIFSTNVPNIKVADVSSIPIDSFPEFAVKEKVAEKPKKQEPDKKEIVYETYTKVHSKRPGQVEGWKLTLRTNRTYFVEKGSDYKKYLGYIFDDSIKKCKAQEYVIKCTLTSVSYFEINNPSNNSKIFNANGLTVNDIKVGWNGIENGTPIIAEKPKKQEPKKEEPKAKPDDNKIVAAASGTGFFVSRTGHIITNHHVIDGCKVNKLSFKGKEVEALVLAIDKMNDLAILKADLKPSKIYSVATEDAGLLEDIIIAGYPLGKKVSAAIKTSKGSVTALAGYGDNYSEFQTDAALNQGNSGGPIMNQKGNVVGVAVANFGKKEGVESFNFGIKSSTLRTFANANGLNFLPPNNRDLSNQELGALITDGTVYLECFMTVAKIKKMLAEAENRKAFFSEYQ